MTDYIKTELAKYNLPDAEIAELKNKYLKLKVRDLEDVDNYMACKSAYKEVQQIRIAIESKRKELKSSSLDFGRKIDTEAKRLTAGVSEVEDHLMAQRKVIEDEKKRIQEEMETRAREEQERIKREEEERLERVRQEQEQKGIDLKVQQEKIDEANRKIEEEKEKLRLEREKAEQDKIDAENAKIKAEQDEKDRIEREKRHAEEVEKAKEEAAAQAIKDKEEADRKAKEEEIENKKRASDKEKFLDLALTLRNISFPEVKSQKSEDTLLKVHQLLSEAMRLLTKK